MGTTTSQRWRSRQDVVDDRLEGCFYVNDRNRQIKYTNIAHAVRGTVLWTVWERVIIDLNTSDFFTDRFIGCDLIRCYGRGEDREWGYKDMCESMQPFYYDCPLKFLDMVPQVANQEWRNEVVKWHERNRTKRNFNPGVGKLIGLKHKLFPVVEYLGKSPRQGYREIKTRDGREFQCKAAMLTGEVFETWPEAS